MFLLVSTRTGLVLRADPKPVEYGKHEAWPDFAVVQVEGDVALYGWAVLDLDALPESYVCSVEELAAASVSPLAASIPGLFVPDIRDSQREAARREKKPSECAAWADWKNCDALADDTASAAGKAVTAVATIEYALKGTGVELEAFDPYVEAKATGIEKTTAAAVAQSARDVAKAALDVAKAEDAEPVAGPLDAKKAALRG